MDLINEKNGGAVAVQFFQQIFETFFKIAAVFGSCHHGRHIQSQYPLSSQALSDLSRRNALGQRFRQGTFAHAGFPQKAGIVFLAAAEDLNHTVKLRIPAEHRVQLPLLGKPGQIPAVLFTGAAAPGGAHPGLCRQNQLPRQLAAFPGGLGDLHPQLCHPHACCAGTVLQQGTEKVFVFRPGCPRSLCPQNGKLQGLAGLGCQILCFQTHRRSMAAALGRAFHQRRRSNMFAAQEFCCRAVVRFQHGQQDVAGIGTGTSLPGSQRQRLAHRAAGLAGQSFLKIEHKHFPLVRQPVSVRHTFHGQYRRSPGK